MDVQVCYELKVEQQSGYFWYLFLMQRRPTRSTHAKTLFPYTTLFRSEFPVVLSVRKANINKTGHSPATDVPNWAYSINMLRKLACVKRKREELLMAGRLTEAWMCGSCSYAIWDRGILGLHTRPYQKHTAPDDLALKIPRPHKPFWNDKAWFEWLCVKILNNSKGQALKSHTSWKKKNLWIKWR